MTTHFHKSALLNAEIDSKGRLVIKDIGQSTESLNDFDDVQYDRMTVWGDNFSISYTKINGEWVENENV